MLNANWFQTALEIPFYSFDSYPLKLSKQKIDLNNKHLLNLASHLFLGYFKPSYLSVLFYIYSENHN